MGRKKRSECLRCQHTIYVHADEEEVCEECKENEKFEREKIEYEGREKEERSI